MRDDLRDVDPGSDVAGRPFLSAGGEARPPLTDAAQGSAAEEGQVRPYLLTGGRTASDRIQLRLETTVVVSAMDRARQAEASERFERARIVRLCREPRSVAEISALLRVPVGVALVLVGDLVAEGLLTPSEHAQVPPTLDIPLLQRLIQGVSAL